MGRDLVLPGVGDRDFGGGLCGCISKYPILSWHRRFASVISTRAIPHKCGGRQETPGHHAVATVAKVRGRVAQS